VAGDEVIDVVAMGNGRMAAIGAMNMSFGMAGAAMVRSAAGGIGRVDRQDVFFNFALAGMVQAAVVQVIDMAFVQDGLMAAVGAMLMAMVLVKFRHDYLLLVRPGRFRFEFTGMRQRVLYQIDNVSIRQSVKNVSSFPAAANEFLPVENAKPLGDRRKLLVDRGHDFRDAHLSGLQKLQNPKTRGITHGAKQLRRPLQRHGIARTERDRIRMILNPARWQLFRDITPLCSTIPLINRIAENQRMSSRKVGLKSRVAPQNSITKTRKDENTKKANACAAI
jgi:hypothetical protein